MKTILSLFIFIIVLFSTQNGRACTRGNITIGGFNPPSLDFTNTATQTVNFNVTHIAPTTDCIVLVVAEYGNATIFTNRFMQISAVDTIPFNIHKQLPVTAANIIRDQPDLTSTNQLIFPPVFSAAAGSTTNTASFAAQLGAVPVAATPGLYTEAIVLKLLAEPLPISQPVQNWAIIHERALSYNYYLPPEINVVIVDSGNPFNTLAKGYLMNFGVLESGESRSADVMVQTNVGYRLSVSSLNDGVMVNVNSPTNTIAYSFTANATSFNLVGSSGIPVVLSTDPSPHVGDGFRIPITTTVSTLTNPLQGTYQDTLTFTVEAF